MSDTRNPGSVLSSNSRRASGACGSRPGGRRTRRRRPAGIILLIVLVLLALFTMLLISFVVATSGNRQSVMQSARAEQTGDSPQSQLYGAFMQVVRGAHDGNSVMGPHSLLEDIYGHNTGATTPTGQGVRGTILPGGITPSSIGYLTIPDTNRLPGNTPTAVPYLPDSNGSTPQPVSNGDGIAINTQYSHTPILAFQASITNDPFFNTSGTDRPPYGFYAGRLITMLSGPASGHTGKIVGYYYNNNAASQNHFFQVLGFDGAVPNPGDQFLINGRPFSGTGFGFRPQSFVASTTSPYLSGATRLLDACDPSFNSIVTPSWLGATPGTQPGFQYALLPNPRRGVFAPVLPASATLTTQYSDPAGPGGANEDYDAPDFQNMLLAMRIWALPQTSPASTVYQLMTPLPSLHRPDLISYWNTRWTAQSGLSVTSQPLIADANTSGQVFGNTNTPAAYVAARNLLRKSTLRPLSFQDDPATAFIDESENPTFTGSNPYLSSAGPILSPYDIAVGATPYAMKNLIFGPWDVDNDGDGSPDSVWVDLGLPVQQSPDGRRYKPLFAILCVDMDGKLNLNAHSTFRHCPPAPGGAPSRFANLNAPFLMPTYTTGQLNSTYPLKVGSGYGPAEISLHPLFEPGMLSGSPISPPSNELLKLLGGDSNQWLDGRYGEIELTGTALSVPPSVGITWIDDPFNWIRESNLPPVYSWGAWSQHQYPYLPINTNGTMPYIQIPFIENTTMWNSATHQWAQGYGSAYGAPPDLDGDGMLALDLRGQPMYIDYPSTANTSYAGSAGWGEPHEAIDDPYELDLSLNARNDGYSQNTGYPNFGPTG